MKWKIATLASACERNRTLVEQFAFERGEEALAYPVVVSVTHRSGRRSDTGVFALTAKRQ
jgi:hypothetical protein